VRRLVLVLLTVTAVGASGCSSAKSNPALSDGAARQLQADVLAVTKGAAAHDWTVARSALTKLRSDLVNARSAGTVSAARAASIEASVAIVSADLAAAQGSTVTPTQPASTATHTSPTTKPTKTKKGHGGH